MKKTFVLLGILVVVSSLRYETVKMRISQSAVDYINSEIRAVIPTLEAELQNFPLPKLSGQDFRLYKLRLHSSEIGTSSINFQNNGLRLRMDNNRFVMGGDFWISYKGIIGIEGRVTVTASNFGLETLLDFNANQVKSLSLHSCNVYIGHLDIDLHNPILNFITDLLRGAITDQARRMFCDAIKNQGIPAVNEALANLPSHYDVGDAAHVVFVPGYAHVNSDQFLTSSFASVQPQSGDVDWKFAERQLPSGGYSGQCCFWASEYLLNSALGTLIPPGKLETVVDAAQMADLAAPLTTHIKNSAAPLLTLSEEYVFLNAPVNVSIVGAEEDNTPVNLGDYSTDFYLTSATDITYEEFRRAVKEKLYYDLPELTKREVCQDDHENCGWWAGRGECGANPDYMLRMCRKSCGMCDEEKSDSSTNPVEYLLNKVIPSKDYIQFYEVKSDMLNGASRTCGKFRPTSKTRELVHEQIRTFIRSQRRS